MENETIPAAALPLTGIRIVDFTKLLPGPWCTQLLADMGAEVIKVEAPDVGDPSRHNPPRQREHTAYFASVNRNKRSIELDLRSAPGLEAARRLIGWADVVLESFAVGGAKRLGIDYQRARAIKPGIIYCSISGFGQDGPLAASSGHDLVVQAMTGVLSTTGAGEMPQFQAADYAGGAFATIAILSALYRHRATGEGAFLDVAMFDSLLAMSTPALSPGLARAAGGSGTPVLHAWGGNPRYAIYATRDKRYVGVSLLEPGLWAKFCELIGRPDLVFGDERPEDRHSDHGERAALYRTAITDYCAARTMNEIDETMRARDIPVCPILNADEALTSAQAQARGMVYWDTDPHDGKVLRISHPLARAGLADLHRRPPPRLGQHTRDILGELGLPTEQRKPEPA